MLLLYKLALRNLVRNRIRTLLNLLMVIGAFSAIVTFKGFSRQILTGLEETETRGQSGHMHVLTSAMWDGDLPKEKKDAYLTANEDLKQKLKNVSNVELVGDRADALVLISNNNQSIGGLAIGYDPKVETQVEKTLKILDGQGFSGKQDYEVLVGFGIQKQLDIKVGQTLTLVSQTLTGSMSSIEPEVRGIFSTGIAAKDNALIYLPIQATQKLLGTDRIERHVLLLKNGSQMSETETQVKEVIHDRPELIVKNWKDIAVFFQQVSAFYQVQNLLVEVILSVLIFLGILNTVGMSIYERIGEIGTMRALGDQRRQVMGLFLLEGLLLGLIGAVLGSFVATGLIAVINALHIPILLPGQSRPNPLAVLPSFLDYLEAAFLVGFTCVVSSVWPAQKAVRMAITDALRANS